jgi:C_GCAxxG_C_C family probable redox protein
LCSSGFNAVFGKFGITKDLSFKIASVFGAGMGRMQETCGAVTGAFMVIGLKYGFTIPTDSEKREIVLQNTKDFVEEFKKRFNTISCRELLQCDLNTEEGQKKFNLENQREHVCMECIRHSSSILEKVIMKKQ